MALFRRLFIDHPASVSESYIEHLITASGFGTKMVLAGLACVTHGPIGKLVVQAIDMRTQGQFL
jgi:hypothetical protein